MSLDEVELALGLEERFGIRFEPAAILSCRTVVDLIGLVQSRLRADAGANCLSQRAFYAVRRSLVDVLGVARKDIRPETELPPLLHGRRAREVWPMIKAGTGARSWPPLVRSRALFRALVVLLLLGWAAGSVWLDVPRAFALTLIAAFVVAWLTRPLKTTIPAGVARVRDLVPFAETAEEMVWTPDRIADAVRGVIRETFFPRNASLRDDTRFVEDLGLF